MFEDLLFSLGIVMPLFVMLTVGFGLKKVNLINENFAAGGNKLMFYIGLPVIVFRSIYRADIGEIFDPLFVGGMLVITLVTGGLIWLAATPTIKDKPVRGAFVLSAFRGNQAFLGIPLLINLAGDAGAIRATMVVTFILPFANILSIFLLASTCNPDRKLSPKEIFLTIIKNPMVIVTALGLGMAFIGLRLPGLAVSTIDSISDMATPLALLCLGASMRFQGFDVKFKYAVMASLIKVVALPMVFGLTAYVLGFRGYDLAAILLMGGVPSAIAGYAMVVEMGGDGYVAGTIVVISTVLSAFTLTLFIYGIRVLGIVG